MQRFPDKPVSSSPGVLEHLKDGDWLAQIKFDGWRAVVRWDGRDVTLTSRHMEPIPASAPIIKAVYDAVHSMPPVLLDGEWMGRRDGQAESIRLFDLLELEGDWMGNRGAYERWVMLQGLVEPRVDGELVRTVPATTSGYRDFFEFSKELPGAEGIVLKHVKSRFIGSVRRSVDNPEWLKVKFRAGADGQLIVA